MTTLSDTEENLLYVRADRSGWDMRNLVYSPLAELVTFKELIKNIISRDLKVRYKRSIIGVFWTVLAPLMSMLVLYAVFKHAMKVQVPFYASYLLSGIIAWNFFIQSSAAGANSILSAAGLIQKIRLPRVIFPVTAVFNNVVNFCFSFCALLVVILITGAPVHKTLFFTPLMMLPLFLFALGWAMMVSAFNVFFRDIQYIMDIALNALFYLTPILYDPSVIPEQYRWIVSWNPLGKFIFLFRSVVYTGELPLMRTYMICLGMGLVMLVTGWVIFQRCQRKFVYWF